MIDMNSLKTPQQARNLMENAKRLGRSDVSQQAFRRLCQLEGKNHTDPIVTGCRGALAALEETFRQKHGKAYKANYTRQKLARVGEIQCLSDWALKKRETEGFKMLVEAGLADQTGEYVVVMNEARFPASVVAAARKRLADHGVR